MSRSRSSRAICLGALLLLAPASASAQPSPHIEAGQRGMNYLTQATVDWQNQNSVCFACHTQGMSLWGASIGKSQGYDVEPAHIAAIVNRVKVTQQADGTWSHDGGIARRFTTAFAASGLAFYDESGNTDGQKALLRGAMWLLEQQAADGSWPSDSVWSAARSEVFRGHEIYVTTMSTAVMARAYQITQDPRYASARDAGVAWLRGIALPGTQALAFKLLGLLEVATGPDDTWVQDTRTALLAHQNVDGGFGRFMGETSTAYHTGIALHALRQSGLSVDDPVIALGMDWLLAEQDVNGSWPRGAAFLDVTDPVAPSMWPTIALGGSGALGVSATAEPERQVVAPFQDSPQTATFGIVITNSSGGDSEDTYALGVSGGSPGYVDLLEVAEPSALSSELMSAELLTLAPGESRELVLTVIVPRAQPPGVPVTFTVIARSQTDPDVLATASVTVETLPEAPTVGHESQVVFIEGDGASVHVRDSVTLAVQVTDDTTGELVHGNAYAGAVNFFVAGIAVGADDDSDGDGVFAVQWEPGESWPKSGLQGIVAAYSGIDRDEPTPDLRASFATAEITIQCHGDLWEACTFDCPCGDGEGDCDDDSECTDGLRCMRDVGLDFGYADPELDVCVAGCPNVAPGGINFCTAECRCEHGEGDCDSDSECEAGSRCVMNVGLEFGYADPALDVCVAGCPAVGVGSSSFCTVDCPCDHGQGDCDSEEECVAGTSCMHNVGDMYGYADPDVDVCVIGCHTDPLGDSDYCTSACPCNHGEGDCDSNAQCAPGLLCAKDVGAGFGFAPDLDVCVTVAP